MNVSLVRMLVQVLVFFHTECGNVRVRAFDSALNAVFKLIGNVRYADRIELLLTGLNVSREFRQRCQEHVSCRAHIAFDIKSLHCLPPILPLLLTASDDRADRSRN